MNYLTYVIDFFFLSWLTTLTWVLITHSKSFDALESKWEGEQEGIDEPIPFKLVEVESCDDYYLVWKEHN